MKKPAAMILTGLVMLTAFTACTDKNKLEPNEPITLTLWHVYGEQADSPMNRLIEEFNQTTGREKGIIIDVTLMSNASAIGTKLIDAQNGKPGVPAMPDLFFCHSSNAAELGEDDLINWNDMFTKAELDSYVPEFVDDGTVNDKLLVFPVSKSTHVLYIAGTQFERFSADTNVTYSDLSDWSGFFSAAEKYYEWSGGKPFCAIDYPIRCIELNALEKGAGDLYTDDGWYDLDNEIFRGSWLEFAEAIAKGHIVAADLYSNTQVMTGEVAAGLGSSASVLYYNDTVTYPDNTSEPMDLQVLPMPKAKGEELLVTQAGVGLCAYKTTEQKTEAAKIFAEWLTESDRNLEFCIETGYMPVNKTSFDKIKDHSFSSEAYKNLYTALCNVNETAQAVKEPSFSGYYQKIYTFYDELRAQQSALAERYKNGEDAEELANELWEMFCSIK